MKKVFAIVLPLCLLVALAVPALAAISVGTDQLINSPIGKAGCVSVEDGVEYLQTIPAASMTVEQREIYDKFLALPDNRKMIFGNYLEGYITFVIPKENAKISLWPGLTASFVIETDGFISFRANNNLLVTGVSVPSGNLSMGHPAGASGSSAGVFYLIMGSDFERDIINGTSPNPHADFLKYYHAKNSFRDDLPKSTYTLTINYQYTDGSKADDSVTTPFAAGAEYSVASPAITGFTPDVPTVTGTMPDENLSVTVTYSKNVATHNLTVNYQYIDGSKAADSVTTPFAAGAEYSVASPAITGFTPDVPTVSGIMPNEDVSVTVTYAPNAVLHTLTVNYQYEDGSKAADSQVSEHVLTAPYYVQSPVIAGFTPDVEFVSGRMGEADLTVTVVYTKKTDSGGGDGGGDGGGTGGGTGGVIPPWTGYNPFVKPDDLLEPWTGYNPFVNPSTEPEPWTGYNPFVNPSAEPEPWTGYNPFVNPYTDAQPKAWTGYNPFVKPEFEEVPRSEYPDWWPK